METSYGTDFSGVRIHEGQDAPKIGAIAFTRGSDIHFAPGRFQPGSHQGQTLIGHELAHVVQQRAGRVAVPQGKGLPINSDPALEAEADNWGARAAGGARVSGSPALGRASAGRPLQRAPYQRSTPAAGRAVPASGPAIEPIQCWPDTEEDKDLMRRGLAYGGVASYGALVHHNVHKHGGSKASGYERGMLGLMKNFGHFMKAPGPIKAATVLGIGGGAALSYGTGFTQKLKEKFFGKK